MDDIVGHVHVALASLTPSQLTFLQNLPKAELHAHLNGCIPIHVLQELASERAVSSDTSISNEIVQKGIERLKAGVVLKEIHDFFGLFPAIYALTSNPSALARATHAVLAQFLDGVPSQAAYLELRSTPRETPDMSRLRYIQTVLDEVERYPPERAALIVSVDRRMSEEVARDCVECAVRLRKEGRRVVGVDLCGDPLAGEMSTFEQCFRLAKEAGLGVTLHIAETRENTIDDTLKLLSFSPDRLGHATFLGAAEQDFVRNTNTCVEICLTSNLLCKTVETLGDHHIRYYLKYDHPVCICTDDTLPFRNSLLGEYALLMAAPSFGLGLSEAEITRIAQMGMDSRFKLPSPPK
ncbi:Metallo-dependent hydrolase [Cristinia sonorae]|uniref:Metallo-dependent hydrolase n=1 Tax=Cristinia sonorae TaxID=1940300 RepID=A0A8K0XR41_9AGAR|nr:Metallo-dependent hydrolase [Cristinia sonorae]